jgi:hypothetical protein
MAASKEEQKIRRRSLKKLHSSSSISNKEDARKAVQLASRKALDAANGGGLERASGNLSTSAAAAARAPSMDNSYAYSNSSSLGSHELAVRRGSSRGLFEGNETGEDAASFSLSENSLDYEMTTTTETKASTLSDHNQRKSMWNKLVRSNKKRSRKKKKSTFLTAEITQEAWMCGVCAKSFSSLAAAEKHEDYHVKEVVMDLGWAGDPFNNDSSNLVLRSELHSPSTSPPPEQLVAKQFLETNRSPGVTVMSQPRPDVLTKSNRNLTASRVSFQDRAAPESPTPFPERLNLNLPRLQLDSRYNFLTKKSPPILRNNGAKMTPIEEEHDFPGEHDLLVPHGMREYVVLADEALVDVCFKARPLILTHDEMDAELELEWLAKDKSHYDLITERAMARAQQGTYIRFRTEGKNVLCQVQNKFVDAYQLMKEGDTNKNSPMLDHYNRKGKGDEDQKHAIEHTKKTLYVNVIVKNSIQVVSHELERLAKQRWEDSQVQANKTILKDGANETQAQRFQKFRAAAQGNLVKLAGLALASDFTPRRIAVQLSNDLYRLLTPRLKRRGITIATEIEYRVGPYFVLAVNIESIDWGKLIRATHRDVAERKLKWDKDQDVVQTGQAGVLVCFVVLCYRLSRMTKYEVLAQCLAWLYYFHWVIYLPICFVSYHLFLGSTFRTFILSSVADGKKCLERMMVLLNFGFANSLIHKHFASCRDFLLRRRKRNGDGSWDSRGVKSSGVYAVCSSRTPGRWP